MKLRKNIIIKGIVQGVGFRPFIHKLVSYYHLYGWVLNSDQGVEIDIEGEEIELKKFIVDIQKKLPPLAKIEEMNVLFLDKLNKIAMYHNDEWEDHLLDKGVQEIIRILRDYYLESYERFMLKKIYHDSSISAYNRNTYLFQLRDYYKFLAYFELYPYARQKTNNEILEGGKMAFIQRKEKYGF